MLPATPPTAESAIFGETSLQTIYVVDEAAKALYQNCSPWNEYEIIALTTGVKNTKMGENIPDIIDCYDLCGNKLGNKQCRGPVIVRYSDGNTRKIMVK